MRLYYSLAFVTGITYLCFYTFYTCTSTCTVLLVDFHDIFGHFLLIFIAWILHTLPECSLFELFWSLWIKQRIVVYCQTFIGINVMLVTSDWRFCQSQSNVSLCLDILAVSSAVLCGEYQWVTVVSYYTGHWSVLQIWETQAAYTGWYVPVAG